MEKTRDMQKKELIFRILDEMKESGEKINADKVAKLAQMGKQTVLPYYNEWRFLADAQKQEGNELPDDLVRALQRMLINWKHELSEEFSRYRSQADQEIEQLNGRINTLYVEQEEMAERLAKSQDDNQALEQTLRENQQYLLKKDEQIKEFQLKSDHQHALIFDLEQRLAQAKKQHDAQLYDQEKKIDQQYRLQIDHWMKALDEERQQAQKIAKEQQAVRTKLLACEKEKGSLENQIEHKSQAYIEACEERNQLRQVLKSQQSSLTLFSKIQLLLDAEESEALEKTKSFLIMEQRYQQCCEDAKNKQAQIQALEKKLNEAAVQESSVQALKLELEKSRGFAQALEQALGKKQKMDQK